MNQLKMITWVSIISLLKSADIAASFGSRSFAQCPNHWADSTCGSAVCIALNFQRHLSILNLELIKEFSAASL